MFRVNVINPKQHRNELDFPDEKSPGQTMLEVLVRLLKNGDGFTATEVGLMTALAVIYIEWVLGKF